MANVFPETRNQLDPPLWSLHIEVSFYVVLPLIGLALLRAKRPWVVCVWLIAAGPGVDDHRRRSTPGRPRRPGRSRPTSAPSPRASSRQRSNLKRAWPRFSFPPSLLAARSRSSANAIWHSGGGTGVPGHAIGDLPAALGFGAIIWGISARPGRLLSSAPFRVLGTLSFGIYLWHMPVLYALQLHDRFPERFLPAIAWVLPFTFLLATASWFLIEKPAIAWSGRALPKRPAPEPVTSS